MQDVYITATDVSHSGHYHVLPAADAQSLEMELRRCGGSALEATASRIYYIYAFVYIHTRSYVVLLPMPISKGTDITTVHEQRSNDKKYKP